MGLCCLIILSIYLLNCNRLTGFSFNRLTGFGYYHFCEALIIIIWVLPNLSYILIRKLTKLVFLTFQKQFITTRKMSTNLVNIAYPIENYLKLLFIPMAIINAQGTVLVACIVTVMALLRVAKRPSFTKEYAQKVLLNNHGQNLMYLGLGVVGNTNLLYYAPLMLFFGFGFAEFINQKYPNTKYSHKYMPYVNLMRNQKFYIMQGKAKLQIVYFVFLLLSLPLDFMNRLLKVFIMGQYMLMKFRIANEFRFGCSEVHKFIDSKTKSIGFLNSLYNKLINYVYKFATSDPRQAQQQ